MKRGILLVAYGCGNIRGAAALRAVQAAAEARFGLPVRWAFTSEAMRARLAHSRTKSDSVLKALKRMRFERYTHVAVQPLYVVPGIEYGEIVEEIAAVRAEGALSAIGVGAPLLDGATALERTGKALLMSLPPERRSDDAVLFMGHGSVHASERWYAELSRTLGERDPFVFLGTLRGQVRVEQVLPRLRKLGVRRVWLMPLLAVVGRHALEDMAGDGDSWKTRLESAGFSCFPVLRGLAESPGVAQLWLERLALAGGTVFSSSLSARHSLSD